MPTNKPNPDPPADKQVVHIHQPGMNDLGLWEVTDGAVKWLVILAIASMVFYGWKIYCDNQLEIAKVKAQEVRRED